MEQLKVVGKAVFANADDESGFMYEATVVTHKGKLWLVATWAQLHATAERIPEWLVPLDAVARWGHELGGQTWTTVEVPKELAGPDAQIPAMQRAGAVLNPVLVHTPGPGSIH